MTFEAKQMTQQPIKAAGRTAKAKYPFAELAADFDKHISVPASMPELHPHCRSMASIFNRTSAIKIRCSKQSDGSLCVFAERPTLQEPKVTGETITDIESTPHMSIVGDISEEKITNSDPKPEDGPIPTKQQFIDWLESLAVGTSVMLNKDYMLRFQEFEMYICELNGFDSEVTYNPPMLKITRKG